MVKIQYIDVWKLGLSIPERSHITHSHVNHSSHPTIGFMMEDDLHWGGIWRIIPVSKWLGSSPFMTRWWFLIFSFWMSCFISLAFFCHFAFNLFAHVLHFACWLWHRFYALSYFVICCGGASFSVLYCSILDLRCISFGPHWLTRLCSSLSMLFGLQCWVFSPILCLLIPYFVFCLLDPLSSGLFFGTAPLFRFAVCFRPCPALFPRFPLVISFASVRHCGCSYKCVTSTLSFRIAWKIGSAFFSYFASNLVAVVQHFACRLWHRFYALSLSLELRLFAIGLRLFCSSLSLLHWVLGLNSFQFVCVPFPALPICEFDFTMDVCFQFLSALAVCWDFHPFGASLSLDPLLRFLHGFLVYCSFCFSMSFSPLLPLEISSPFVCHFGSSFSSLTFTLPFRMSCLICLAFYCHFAFDLFARMLHFACWLWHCFHAWIHFVICCVGASLSVLYLGILDLRCISFGPHWLSRLCSSLSMLLGLQSWVFSPVLCLLIPNFVFCLLGSSLSLVWFRPCSALFTRFPLEMSFASVRHCGCSFKSVTSLSFFRIARIIGSTFSRYFASNLFAGVQHFACRLWHRFHALSLSLELRLSTSSLLSFLFHGCFQSLWFATSLWVIIFFLLPPLCRCVVYLPQSCWNLGYEFCLRSRLSSIVWLLNCHCQGVALFCIETVCYAQRCPWGHPCGLSPVLFLPSLLLASLRLMFDVDFLSTWVKCESFTPLECRDFRNGVCIDFCSRLSRSTRCLKLNAGFLYQLKFVGTIRQYIDCLLCHNCAFCLFWIIVLEPHLGKLHRDFRVCFLSLISDPWRFLCDLLVTHQSKPHFVRHICCCSWHFANLPPLMYGDSKPCFAIKLFDSTLGFPGEGPKVDSTWSCVSANINSIRSHPHALQWEDDVICLQETRISKSNIGFFQNICKDSGRNIFHGQLLEEKRRCNGHFHTPHGGVACVAPTALARAFTSDDDSTGHWKMLQASSRITAVWVQVLPKIRCLIFSFYGQTAMENQKHIDINEDILQRVFSVASQFGDIPILLAGDFQADPDHYQAIQCAKSHGQWIDPLCTNDSLGNPTRPITYSRSSNFIDPDDNYSSIDAIIMNKTAAAALLSCDIVHSDVRQHSPIKVSFSWERIFQEGFVLNKPAPLDLSGLPLCENKIDHAAIEANAKVLWQDNFSHKCSNTDHDQAWQAINDFAVCSLTSMGAKFKKGLQTRGRLPEFSKFVACPGQTTSGTAVTSQSAKLSKVHKLLSELNRRLSRPSTNHADFCITMKLQTKVTPIIPTIPGCETWDPAFHMNAESIAIVQTNLQQKIIKVRESEKRARILSWRKRMIQATQSKNIDKTVYKWINEKTKSATPNLITNADGNIIYSPTEALMEINQQWDKIFSANIFHENPEKILHFVWPYLKDQYNQIELPPLSGEALRKQCLKRKVNAASGLDGWRTVEVQSLPVCVFDAVATFFRQIECGSRDFPKAISCVKQVLLDKQGDDTPLQKRIISLMSVFVVSYTGLRYSQLHVWQAQTLPKELYGGIKGRHMSDVFNQLQLQVDDSVTNKDGLIGLKLDKSKCFDRLVPSISAALFIAFGLPSTLTLFFTKFYNHQKRFLAYKEWISDKPTTACNGLIQGCSLSLLAINLHMSVWVNFLKCIPGIHMCAFIDDSYIWVKYNQAELLNRAIQVTQLWDQMVGQELNVSKCQCWATCPASRRKAKEILPNLALCETVVVLGARIQTTLKKSFQWPKTKTLKILRDLELVKTIPTSRVIHEHLIAAKIIPQLSFAPQINTIPKVTLTKIQNHIADVLWKGRPSWRAKGLLLGILAKPHRCDPVISRAFRTLFECFAFLKTTSSLHKEIWTSQFESSLISVNSLISHTFQACAILGIELVQPFHFSIWHSSPVSFLDFSKRDLKMVLIAACRHTAYYQASRSARKDLSASQQFLDFPSTEFANKICASTPHGPLNLLCFRDSVVVGCVASNDRRSAAGMVDCKSCRFCGHHDETFGHLAIDCPSLPLATERPIPSVEFGPNFLSHGIVEVNDFIVQQRLTISSPSHIPVCAWDVNSSNQCSVFWTDGSCEHQESFWFCSGAYAVINARGKLVSSGAVSHWALSSYSCELWAILVAFFGSENNTVCVTDCLSVFHQFNSMVTNNFVDPTWSHLEWWNALHHVYSHRTSFSNNPLCLRWCPAHILEQFHVDLITETMANRHNTTRIDLVRNRQADKEAKKALQQSRMISTENWQDRKRKISTWQFWLARVAACLSSDPDNDSTVVRTAKPACRSTGVCPPGELTLAHDISHFQHYFPKWDWDSVLLFPWKTKFDCDTELASYASLSNQQWHQGLNFFQSLRWCENPDFKTAFLELAFFAWQQGWQFVDVPNTISGYTSYLRKVCNQASKLPGDPLTPGIVLAKHKSQGKTLPSGCISGAWFCANNVTLKHLAIHCLSGKSQSLSSWEVPF